MDRVMIPFGTELLILTGEELEVARGRGRDYQRPVPVTPLSDGRLVDVRAVASEFSLPKSTVYEYAKSGRIPSVRVSPKKVRFDLAAVRDALNRKTS